MAIQKEPNNGPYHYALAALLALDGNLAEARPHLRKAESLGVHVEVLRGWILRKYGQAV